MQLRCTVVMLPESAIQMDKRVRHIVIIIYKHMCTGVVEVYSWRVNGSERAAEPLLDHLKLVRQTVRPLSLEVNPLAQRFSTAWVAVLPQSMELRRSPSADNTVLNLETFSKLSTRPVNFQVFALVETACAFTRCVFSTF